LIIYHKALKYREDGKHPEPRGQRQTKTGAERVPAAEGYGWSKGAASIKPSRVSQRASPRALPLALAHRRLPLLLLLLPSLPFMSRCYFSIVSFVLVREQTAQSFLLCLKILHTPIYCSEIRGLGRAPKRQSEGQ